MKNKSYNFLIPIGFAFAIILGIVIGKKINAPLSARIDNSKYGKLQNIMFEINQRYVDNVNSDSLFEASIGDMLHQLDPHSNYIPAQDLMAMQESIQGRFGGVGIRFAIIRDTVRVTHVIPNSPSFEADVKAGDYIIGINRKSFVGKEINNEKVMKNLKGLEGTNVQVDILRNGKKLTKNLRRGMIPISSISAAYMVSPGLGFIRLEEFSMTSSEEFETAAKKLLKNGMTKLIFDLRDNGGGVLNGAVEIVDQFLVGGKTIVSTKGENARPEIYRATSRGILENIEVVLLINQNSASASEIVAGALQDNDRATVVGRRSFGKGLVQQDIQLVDGSNLRLTVARYYTPTGRCIQKFYDGNYQNYIMEEMDRYTSGELYKPDSSLMVDSLRFKTPKGKYVYGGGGIMPDIFVGIDTTTSTWYYSKLRATGSFADFAFEYLITRRNSFKSLTEFVNTFEVSEAMISSLVAYAKKEHKVEINATQLAKSKIKIKNYLKAEIARSIWQENGFFSVFNREDIEVKKAMNQLK